MTRMFRVIPKAAIVSARRLFETAVTPCDCSIENATTRAYRRIAADERDVGSVQCGQHPRRRRHAVGRQDLTEPDRPRSREARRSARARCRADRSRDRRTRAVASGEQVLRFAEQRICRRLDPLEREARGTPARL